MSSGERAFVACNLLSCTININIWRKNLKKLYDCHSTNWYENNSICLGVSTVTSVALCKNIQLVIGTGVTVAVACACTIGCICCTPAPF